MRLVDDPRWIEYRETHTATQQGLRAPAGSHERHRESLLPFCELMAEQTAANGMLRREMMSSLFVDGFPLGIIAFAFTATEAEIEYVSSHPPIQMETLSEQDRLLQMPYRLYLKSDHWKAVRADALKRANGRCQFCNGAEALEVHHRTYERKGCERPADVIVLCARCHSHHHNTRRAA